jgi:predicted SAM-dependent methyltransferase
MSKLLNLGCGSTKITGAWNVDMSPDVGADQVQDLRKPFEMLEGHYSEVYFFHCIEHLEKKYHPFVLDQIWRVMELGGKLIISYPEFENIARNWLENKGNDRAFWEATIYGRQLYPGDYHISAISTTILRELLFELGFEVEAYYPEPGQDFNTVLIARKAERPITYEEVLKLEVFG